MSCTLGQKIDQEGWLMGLCRSGLWSNTCGGRIKAARMSIRWSVSDFSINLLSSSIYFMAQNRQVYKWKQVGRTIEVCLSSFIPHFVSNQPVLQCINTQTNRTVAQYDDGHQLPQMRIWGEGAFISTELFVTWYLSMTAKRCSWRIYTPRELSNLRRW